MAVLKVYNGATWDEPVLKFHNGTSFVTPAAKFYNGSSWVELVTSVVTLSGGTWSTSAASGTMQCGIRINTDGTIDKRLTASYTQQSASTDWIIPNGDASSAYSFKLTQNSGAALASGSLALNTWYAMSVNREFFIERLNLEGDGTTTGNYTLHVSDDGGATTITTAVYIFTINNT